MLLQPLLTLTPAPPVCCAYIRSQQPSPLTAHNSPGRCTVCRCPIINQAHSAWQTSLSRGEAVRVEFYWLAFFDENAHSRRGGRCGGRVVGGRRGGDGDARRLPGGTLSPLACEAAVALVAKYNAQTTKYKRTHIPVVLPVSTHRQYPLVGYV